MTDVFISYARQQRPQVDAIAQALRDLDLEVWFDRELTAGEAFSDEIERFARSCRAMIVCWTPDAADSTWVVREAAIGVDRNVLAPVFLAECHPPAPFDALMTVDLCGWRGDHTDTRWKDVLKRLEALTGKPELRAAAAALVEGRRNDLVTRVRRELVQVARRQGVAFYEQTAQKFGVEQRVLWATLDAIAEENRARREPPLCALVIGKHTGLPGKGYFQKQAFLHDHMDPLATAVWGRHRDRVWDFDWPDE